MTTCLIVEYAFVNRTIIAAKLELFGITTRSSTNGKEALLFCQQTMPDLIVLDYHMSATDGLDYLQKICDLKEGIKPKLIVYSAAREAEQLQRVTSLGAHVILPKPFSSKELKTALITLGVTTPRLNQATKHHAYSR